MGKSKVVVNGKRHRVGGGDDCCQIGLGLHPTLGNWPKSQKFLGQVATLAGGRTEDGVITPKTAGAADRGRVRPIRPICHPSKEPLLGVWVQSASSAVGRWERQQLRTTESNNTAN